MQRLCLNQTLLTEPPSEGDGLSSGALPSRQRKQVTILFADIVGSTRIIEKLDAEVAMGLFSQSLGTLKEAVEVFGGVVSKEMGDGIMAIFGAPISKRLSELVSETS